MEKELVEKIVAVAPYMFRYENWNNPQHSLLCFGFEVGDGWYKLLEELVLKISEVDKERAIRVVQIKEKFGTLRFYVSWSTEEIDKLIEEAEKKSSNTCDICGGVSKVKNKNGWLHNICDICESDDHK